MQLLSNFCASPHRFRVQTLKSKLGTQAKCDIVLNCQKKYNIHIFVFLISQKLTNVRQLMSVFMLHSGRIVVMCFRYHVHRHSVKDDDRCL